MYDEDGKDKKKKEEVEDNEREREKKEKRSFCMKRRRKEIIFQLVWKKYMFNLRRKKHIYRANFFQYSLNFFLIYEPIFSKLKKA